MAITCIQIFSIYLWITYRWHYLTPNARWRLYPQFLFSNISQKFRVIKNMCNIFEVVEVSWKLLVHIILFTKSLISTPIWCLWSNTLSIVHCALVNWLAPYPRLLRDLPRGMSCQNSWEQLPALSHPLHALGWEQITQRHKHFSLEFWNEKAHREARRRAKRQTPAGRKQEWGKGAIILIYWDSEYLVYSSGNQNILPWNRSPFTELQWHFSIGLQTGNFKKFSTAHILLQLQRKLLLRLCTHASHFLLAGISREHLFWFQLQKQLYFIS